MRTWRETVATTKCGVCGEDIPAGGRVQAVEVPNVKRVLFRCERCADDSVSVAPKVVNQQPPMPMHSFRDVAMTGQLFKPSPYDYKVAQYGEDD